MKLGSLSARSGRLQPTATKQQRSQGSSGSAPWAPPPLVLLPSARTRLAQEEGRQDALPRRALQRVQPVLARRMKLQVVAFKGGDLAVRTDAGLARPAAAGLRFRFIVPQYVTSFGQSLKVVGSLPELGQWDLDGAPAMAWREGHQWVLDVQLPSKNFEFKVVVCEGSAVRWEGGNNRVVQAEGDDQDVPVEITVYLTCVFNATETTPMHLAVPRASLESAYETGRAALEFLERRKAKIGQDIDQVPESERHVANSELFKLSEALVEQRSTVMELGNMLEHAAPSSSSSGLLSDDDAQLLLAIDMVAVPRALRRISFSNVASEPALLGAAGESPSSTLFLRAELGNRAEELLSTANDVYTELKASHNDGDAAVHSSLASLAEEASHVAAALASLGGSSSSADGDLLNASRHVQLEGLASMAASANGTTAPGTAAATAAAAVSGVSAAAGSSSALPSSSVPNTAAVGASAALEAMAAAPAATALPGAFAVAGAGAPEATGSSGPAGVIGAAGVEVEDALTAAGLAVMLQELQAVEREAAQGAAELEATMVRLQSMEDDGTGAAAELHAAMQDLQAAAALDVAVLRDLTASPARHASVPAPDASGPTFSGAAGPARARNEALLYAAIDGDTAQLAADDGAIDPAACGLLADVREAVSATAMAVAPSAVATPATDAAVALAGAPSAAGAGASGMPWASSQGAAVVKTSSTTAPARHAESSAPAVTPGAPPKRRQLLLQHPLIAALTALVAALLMSILNILRW